MLLCKFTSVPFGPRPPLLLLYPALSVLYHTIPYLLELGEDLLVVGGHGRVGDEQDHQVALLDSLVPGKNAMLMFFISTDGRGRRLIRLLSCCSVLWRAGMHSSQQREDDRIVVI